jgi:hypothetical protein
MVVSVFEISKRFFESFNVLCPEIPCPPPQILLLTAKQNIFDLNANLYFVNIASVLST